FLTIPDRQKLRVRLSHPSDHLLIEAFHVVFSLPQSLLACRQVVRRILESCLFGREILPVGSNRGEALVHGRAGGPDLLSLPLDGLTFGLLPCRSPLQVLTLRVELRPVGNQSTRS